jgi:hypothetical protein
MEKTIFKTLQEIAAIPVPSSMDYMKGYQAVPHIEVVNNIKETLDKKNLGIVKEVYKVNKGGNILYGSILTDMKNNDDLGGGIHFVNSYDKSRMLEIRAGAIVFICSNGMVRMQEFSQVKRKHVGTVMQDLLGITEFAVNSLEHEYMILGAAKERLQEQELSKRTRAELVGRLFAEHELLSVTQMSILKQELDRKNGAFLEPTAWSFYNNVTETLKSSHPYDYISNHEQFHEFMMEEFV